MLSKNDESNQIIRKIEKDVLDEHCNSYTFLYRPQEVTIPQLLKIFGHIERDIFNTPQQKVPFSWIRMAFNRSTHGLGHCLRWILLKANKSIKLPHSSWKTLDEEAQHFLGWGINYSKLAQDHVAWGRGVTVPNIDTRNQVISFEYPPDYDLFFVVTQAMSEELTMKTLSETIPYELLRKHFQIWFESTIKKPEMIYTQLSWEHISKPKKIFLDWLNGVLWPELSAATDLKGYTLNEFRHFYSALFIHSLFIALAEDEIDIMLGPEHMFGSVITTMPKRQFVSWLSEISKVKTEAVIHILDDLTFNPYDFHSSVITHPFIVSNSGMVFLLGRYIARLDPNRVLSGALNNKGKQKIYSKLVQRLEQAALNNIEELLTRKGYLVYREKNLFSHDGIKIQPDFLIYHRQTRELLVIDYKHTLVPISISEAITKSEVLNKSKDGLAQVNNYINFLKSHLSLLNFFIGYEVDDQKIFGFLLFRWPMPIPTHRDSQVPAVDWPSLSNWLSQNETLELAALVDWIKTRPDLEIDPLSLVFRPEEIKVNGWSYIHYSIGKTDQLV